MECGNCGVPAIVVVCRQYPVCAAHLTEVTRIARIYHAVAIGGRTIKEENLYYHTVAEAEELV